MLGLTLAHRLAQHGHHVTVLEAAPHLGGLASAWQLADVVWDRHYHVTLLSDSTVRTVLDELGLEREMEWVETRTGVYSGGHLYSVSNGLEFLRFPPLPLLDKLRLGGTIVYGSRVRDWQRLERLPVERWLTTWSGQRTVQRFWLPLLKAKLGDSYQEANAAFIWATIQRLYAARRTGLKKEMFGYVPGGYARILERFGDSLRARGVELQLGAAARSVVREGDVVVVEDHNGARREFDDVVVTANASIAARLITGLTGEERSRLEAIQYQGIVCASVLLRRPLSPYYLTYITDDAPFTAVVEMTAFVDPRHFGGRSLIYLPKYCRPDDEVAQLDDGQVEQLFLEGLGRMYPDFSRADVLAFRVSRVREVFAVPTIGYSEGVPSVATSVPGVHLVTSAQIVNGTLNVEETMQLAERGLDALLGPDEVRPEGTPAQAVRAASGRPGDAGPPGDQPRRPSATLSVDLDDLWSYLKTNGDAAWRSFPSFLELVVPRLLALLDERGQASTWFVVGKDASVTEHGPLLRSVAGAGHEIGNHSYLHEPWMHRYPATSIADEIARAERAIEDATGVRPTGFRGPGYSLSGDVIDVLRSRGYRYDASTLPTFIGPLARWYYLRGRELDGDQQEERSALFGPAREGFRPLRPYRWDVGDRGLVELPVTTVPGLRTPMHVSYLIFLAERSPTLAHRYLDTSLRWCRRLNIAPSLLLHSHDVVGADDVPAMRFFPGFRLPGQEKLALVASFVDRLRRDFDVVPLGAFVDTLTDAPTVRPRFVADGAKRLTPTPIPTTPTGGAP
jgi:protoporphyrinogen oxidase